ncbi:DHS-like NAD/FAD-binding domain-containing protein [Butyriboletus roseoflavus]|nr:DHS-like NAD/FAD-binding domain-containing protein [Butyriboletus roseoflavus]
MTLFVPLDENHSPPSYPPFLVHPVDVPHHLRKALRAILKARRLVVVCGAGISVQAGIPDFRSPTGLFQTLKRDNPKEGLTSGKDLFDASVFNLVFDFTAPHLAQNYVHIMLTIFILSELSQAANPTPFHQLLRLLDDRGRLLRVYTQNIDAIESKSGLSFGVPGFEDKRCKPRSRAKTAPTTGTADLTTSTSFTPSRPSVSQPNSRLPSPTIEVPRCIPLHGSLQTLHCQTCTHTFPLGNYMSSLTSGTPPYCPECTQMEETRQLVGKRARGVGKLRPSVVLYNEMHRDGEGVGEVVRRDLVGGSKGKGRSGADVLLVVGTSLRVPGTKRIVREFSKAVRSRGSASSKEFPESTSTCAPTPSPSPRQSLESKDGCPPIKSIYLNFDFPVPTREWEGVFDAWVQGDAQSFAHILMDEIVKEAAVKEAVLEKKRKREEEAASGEQAEATDQAPPAKKRKTMNQSASKTASSRKRKSSEGPRSAPRKPRSDKKSTRPTPSKTLSGSASKPTSSEKVYIRIPSRCRVPEVVISTQASLRVQTFPATPATSRLKHRMHSSADSKHDNECYPLSDNTDSNPTTDSDLSDVSSDTEPPDELPIRVSLAFFRKDAWPILILFMLHYTAGCIIVQEVDRYPKDMSSTPNTSKPEEKGSKAPEKPKSDDTPHLGVLEEDDEFEEFECADWDDSQTDLAHLKGAAPGVANSSGDKLWEDNWDDDDIEDEFSVQLRNELAKTGKGDPMQH